MEILGIGPLELFFIVLIALIVLGPKDMVKAGRTIGQLLRKLVTSPNWRVIQQASKDIRYLPNRLMREAGLDDIQKELPSTQNIRKEIGLDDLEKEVKDFQSSLSDWTTPPSLLPIDEEKPIREEDRPEKPDRAIPKEGQSQNN